MGQQPDEALEVLRTIWNARGQTREELDEAFGTARSCKNMANVGFDGWAEDEADLRAAWRTRLEREGKLNDGAGSIADLIAGPAEGRQ